MNPSGESVSYSVEEEQRVGFFGRGLSIYTDLIRLEQKMQRPRKSLDFVERAKSRTFLDQLALTADSARDIETSIFSRVGDISARLRKQYQLLNQATGEQRVELERAILATRENLDKAIDQVTIENPDLGGLLRGTPATMEQIQWMLKV